MQPQVGNNRLQSLDFFRGLTMFLLVGEMVGVFEVLDKAALKGTVVAAISAQFQHHEWNGLHFWDLIQPFFMFIVGVAMPFSFGKRWERGDSWGKTFLHALQRSFLLFLFGWALYCIGPGKITFELWNVLTQLSFTFLVAFLMMRKRASVQIVFTLGLLILTEALYRLWSVEGYNQPFTPDHNFGSWVDMLLMGKLSRGHWVAFNAIPTTAHTMWGVLAGLVLKSDRRAARKIGILLLAGVIGVVVGYALNPVTPIIKRICTPSFVIVSGGWCLVALAASYWLIDVLKIQRVPAFFAIVGMNPLFIYLFAHTEGTGWLKGIVKPFTHGLFARFGEIWPEATTALVVWAMAWCICYWLYKRRIYIRI